MNIAWPTYLIENITRAGQALIDKVSYYFDLIESETLEISDMTDPLRCPEKFLKYLGEDVGARIKSGDTIRVKRLKAIKSIGQKKNKSLWLLDLKLRIESVLGYAVSLYSVRGSQTYEDAIFWGGTETRTRRWSLFGTTGSVSIDARGEIFAGKIIGIPFTEAFLPGVLLVNLTTTQTAETLVKIIIAINEYGGYVGNEILVGYLSGSIFTVEARA